MHVRVRIDGGRAKRGRLPSLRHLRPRRGGARRRARCGGVVGLARRVLCVRMIVSTACSTRLVVFSTTTRRVLPPPTYTSALPHEHFRVVQWHVLVCVHSARVWSGLHPLENRERSTVRDSVHTRAAICAGAHKQGRALPPRPAALCPPPSCPYTRIRACVCVPVPNRAPSCSRVHGACIGSGLTSARRAAACAAR